MLKKLNWRTKNQLLSAGAVVLLILSWPMAFRKTWDAVSLNRRLGTKKEETVPLSVNPQYLSEKGRRLESLVSHYRVDSASWKNELWLKSSGAASASGLMVSYSPEETGVITDSAATNVMRQTISFEGPYLKLVVLLDSLEKTEGIGFISSAKFEKIKSMSADSGDKLYLRVVFGVITKE